MSDVNINWGLLNNQPNFVQQAFDAYQSGQQAGQQQAVRSALSAYDPTKPDVAGSALIRAGRPDLANNLYQAADRQQKWADMNALSNYKPSAAPDRFAATPTAQAPSPSPGATPGPMSGAAPGETVGAAPGGAPPATSGDITVTGKRPQGYDFRTTLDPQTSDDPVLRQKLALMQARGNLTHEQADAYIQAYSAMPPQVKAAQQAYVNTVKSLALQAANMGGDVDQDPKSKTYGDYMPDNQQAMQQRLRFLQDNTPLLRQRFLSAHPGADPNLFDQSIANVDLSRNGLIALAHQNDETGKLQEALDNAGGGDMDVGKAFEENRHNLAMEAVARTNASANSSRAGNMNRITNAVMGPPGGAQPQQQPQYTPQQIENLKQIASGIGGGQ